MLRLVTQWSGVTQDLPPAQETILAQCGPH